MVSQFPNLLSATVTYFVLITLYIPDDIALHLNFPSSISPNGWVLSPTGRPLWWVPADFRGYFSGSWGTLAVWNNLHITIIRAM